MERKTSNSRQLPGAGSKAQEKAIPFGGGQRDPVFGRPVTELTASLASAFRADYDLLHASLRSRGGFMRRRRRFIAKPNHRLKCSSCASDRQGGAACLISAITAALAAVPAWQLTEIKSSPALGCEPTANSAGRARVRLHGTIQGESVPQGTGRPRPCTNSAKAPLDSESVAILKP